ncbi:hypothetical protein P7C70_g3117, partial [Phenoliferia sp. Uapishka_3]
MAPIRASPSSSRRSPRGALRTAVKPEDVDRKPVSGLADLKPKVEPDAGEEDDQRRLRSAAPAVHVKEEELLAVKVEEVEQKLPVAPVVVALPVAVVEYDWPAKEIVRVVRDLFWGQISDLSSTQVDNMQGYWLIEWEDSEVSAAEFKYWKSSVKVHDEPDADNGGKTLVKWWPSWELKSGTCPTLVAEWKVRRAR